MILLWLALLIGPVRAAQPALAQLEAASEGRAFDGAAQRPGLAAAGEDDGRVDSSRDREYARFTEAFLSVEIVAIELSRKSWATKVPAAVLALVLFFPAVIYGGIRAFF